MQVAGSMSVGRLAPSHTLGRDGIRELSKNVTPELTKDNVILVDQLKGRSIEQYTNDRFQPVIDEYNARQTRGDRKIKTPYVDWHKNNGTLCQGKMSLAYECVIQIGEHDSLGHLYYDAEGKQRDRIHDWYEKQYKGLLEDFQERFPHLNVLYAALHFDEKDGTPHMHLCFQPEAECTRGLSTQVSIGRALGQDGIKRAESRLEADKEGFQMTRMYREFHHDFINKRIKEAGFELKEEVQGRKHEDKSYFKDKMLEGTQKLKELEDQLHEREDKIAASEQRAKEGEKLAVDKMKEAALKVLDAKREQEAAAELAALSYAAKEEVDKEIERKQMQVDELKKKLESKTAAVQIKDEIDEIFRQSGDYGIPYPQIYEEKTRKVGKEKKKLVTIEEKDLHNLRNKAAIYEQVTSATRKLEKIADETRKAADKDETVQQLQEENLALKMELQKTKVERNQAERRERDMERSRDEALSFIADKGLGEDFIEEHEQQQEHHHHIHR